MNCKPGDLAVILGPIPEFRDRIVKVERFVGTSIESISTGDHWLVSGHFGVDTVRAGISKIFLWPDEWLRPISGVPLADEVTNEERVSA